MELSLNPQELEEVCPSCGNFADELDNSTGWCFECSGIVEIKCLSCSKRFAKDTPHRRLCATCRDERWLARHADELEIYLSYGARIGFAKREVYAQNRPVCISCSKPIKGATDGAAFCTTTVECRRWRRRYRTLKERYSGTLEPAKIALAEVSAEIFATQHRMEIRS